MERNDSEFYRIDGTINLKRPIGREESCGFNIWLDALFASELLKKIRTEYFVRDLEQEAKNINRRYKFPVMQPHAYHFVSDSTLLGAVYAHSFFDLVTDGSEMDYFIRLCESEHGQELLHHYRSSAGPQYVQHQKIFAFHPTLKCGVCVDFWMLKVPHPQTKVCGFRHRYFDIILTVEDRKFVYGNCGKLGIKQLMDYLLLMN